MKILVIEDDSIIANSLKKGLTQERHVVDIALDGETGYDLASGGNYDVIVLDLMLPFKDGMEICRDLRSNGIKTPIIMLTAKSQVEDRVLGLNTGADDYLPKPFSFDELLARINALSRRPPIVDNKQLKVRDLSIDLDKFQVKKKGREISLSSKEFSLLSFLMKHPNTILTKDKIISQVWEFESDVLPNTVEVYIKNLRAKIDTDEKSPYIKTVRGFGYKFS